MTIWIITMGNRDVQLEKNDNWESLYEEVRYDEPIESCDEFWCPDEFEDKETKRFLIPARVLGLVYGRHPDDYQDLAFPILDTFHDYFKKKLGAFPNKIVVLLTDQSAILASQLDNKHSPYWQDTVELKPIIESYFRQNFQINPQFWTLTPESGRGLDHWDKTLGLVETTLDEKQAELERQGDEWVYISHQAGTPAISSAVQFVSLGLFPKVEFLVSYQYYDDQGCLQSQAEMIASSRYWRGMQVQKAKQLVKDGLPGAALTLYQGISETVRDRDIEKKLDNLVKGFNLEKTCDNRQDEFEVEAAIQRVVNALDLVELFFTKGNYIQGLMLLAAAQETFLKGAIKHELETKTVTLQVKGVNKQLSAPELIVWNDAGLGWVRNPQDKQYRDNELKRRLQLDVKQPVFDEKLEILKRLNFPVDNKDIKSVFWFYDKKNKKDCFQFHKIGINTGMYYWLYSLIPDFQPWRLLTWIAQYERERDADLRNQLMHNLLGVEPQEVIRYLLGNQTDSRYTDVISTYQQEVKKPFIREIKRLNLPFQERGLSEELQQIVESMH